MQRLNLAAIDRLRNATINLVRPLTDMMVTIAQYAVRRQRRTTALAAENLFLRKQLAFFQEREIKPRRADDATRATLVWLSRAFNRRDALVVVKPATVIRWHATRRILQLNVTAHPTADWTLQQLREAIPEDHSYQFLIRDRDAKFSRRLDESIRHLRLQILKTPIRTPQANGLCERTIGTIRRECLNYMISLGERHVCRILSEWVRHYNVARPHTALGPGIPEPGPELPTELQSKRHELPTGARVTARPILFGLHHEYSLQLAA